MVKKVALAVITLVILGVLFVIVRGLAPTPKPPPERTAATQPVPPPPSRGGTTEPAAPSDRIEQRDETGRLVRLFEFENAIPHPDSIDIRRFRVTFYGKPDTADRIAVTTLDAGRAVLHRNPTSGTEPAKPMMLDKDLNFGDADLSGGVRVFHDGGTDDDTDDDIRFRTDSLTYRQQADRMTADVLTTDDAVEGSGSGLSFRGTGLTAQIEPKSRRLLRVRIQRDVSMVLAGETAQGLFAGSGTQADRRGAPREPGPPTRITCRGDFSLLGVQRRATFYRDVKVMQGEASMTADTLEIQFSPREPDSALARSAQATPGRFLGRPQWIEAHGTDETPLKLADPREGRQFAAEGTSLRLDVDRDEGTLKGTPFAVVRHGPRQDTVITARQFRFDRSEGRNLTYAEGNPALTLVDPGEAPDAKPRTVRVSCIDPIVVDGDALTATLKNRVRAVETEADAVRSSVAADALTVFFAKAEKGDQQRRIQRIVAAGNVDALQEGRRIKAKELTIAFATKDRRQEPSRFHATGGVLMTEADERGKAEADEVIAHLDQQRTTLIGKPATLQQGDRIIAAERLDIDARTDPPVVAATGAGRIVMTSTTDRDGRPLEKPQRYLVRWRDTMTFDPKARQGRFAGAVHATLPGATLDCGTLHLHFKPAKAAEEAGQLDIARIVADDDVTFVGEGQTARGRHLTFDMDTQRATVTGTVEKPARVEQADRVVTAPHLDLDREHEAIAAVGPGSLRIVRAGADAPDTGSQIHWQERMDFKAEEKVALFRGGVTARFAGADLRISSGRPDDHLAGRAGVRDLQHIDLDSALMQVTFADVPDTRPTRPGRTDLTVRELVARGNVRVKAVSSDVIRRFEGQRVTFTAADKSTGQTADSLIVIEGGDRGAGPSLTPDLARFWSEGGAGSEASFQERLVSQRILFYPDRGEVVTEDTRLIEVMPRGDTSTAEPTEKPKPVSSRLIWSRG